MAYTKTPWANKPATTTPVDATNLGKIEQGIADAHTIAEDHIADADAAHAASAVSFSPAGLVIVTGTNVQSALAQLDAAVNNRALSNHTHAAQAPDLTDHLKHVHNAAWDSFTRANTTAGLGKSETRELNWIDHIGGGWGIIDGMAYKPGTGYSVAILDCDAHGVTEVTIAAFNTGEEFWLVARVGGTGYVRFGKRSASTTYSFEKGDGSAVAGGAGQKYAFPTAQAGDRLRIISRRNDGIACEVTRGGVTTRYVESGDTYAMGNFGQGIACVGGATVGVRFDDFRFYEL